MPKENGVTLQPIAAENTDIGHSAVVQTCTRMATLSFCITCMNRLGQIRETLPQNLKYNVRHKEIVEFILVNFGSTDGLQPWVTDNFAEEIEEGYLKYFYTEQLSYWHTSIAKNTAHILANNNILVNLDCDNFTEYDGGLFVIENMLKYNIHNTVIHEFNNQYGSGTHGRIALTKQNFLKIGGYDESFGPMWHEDTGLLKRPWVSGMKYIHLADNDYSRSIPNTREESLTNGQSYLRSWEDHKNLNFQKSLQNITSGRLVANGGKESIGIIDGIYA